EGIIGGEIYSLPTKVPAWLNPDTDKYEELALASEVQKLNEKLTLLMEHFNLAYQPAKETTEPAKIVAKTSNPFANISLGNTVGGLITGIAGAGVGLTEPKKPATKRNSYQGKHRKQCGECGKKFVNINKHRFHSGHKN